jgi:hypothetical protein
MPWLYAEPRGPRRLWCSSLRGDCQQARAMENMPASWPVRSRIVCWSRSQLSTFVADCRNLCAPLMAWSDAATYSKCSSRPLQQPHGCDCQAGRMSPASKRRPSEQSPPGLKRRRTGGGFRFSARGHGFGTWRRVMRLNSSATSSPPNGAPGCVLIIDLARALVFEWHPAADRKPATWRSSWSYSMIDESVSTGATALKVDHVLFAREAP